MYLTIEIDKIKKSGRHKVIFFTKLAKQKRLGHNIDSIVRVFGDDMFGAQESTLSRSQALAHSNPFSCLLEKEYTGTEVQQLNNATCQNKELVADTLYKNHAKFLKYFEETSNIVRIIIDRSHAISLESLDIINNSALIQLKQHVNFTGYELSNMIHINGTDIVEALFAFVQFTHLLCTTAPVDRKFSRKDIVQITCRTKQPMGEKRLAHAKQLYQTNPHMTVAEIVTIASKKNTFISSDKRNLTLDITTAPHTINQAPLNGECSHETSPTTTIYPLIGPFFQKRHHTTTLALAPPPAPSMRGFPMEIYTLAQKPNFRESGVADFLFRRYDELIKCFQTASNILKVAINSESDFSLQTLQVIDDPVFIDLHKRSYFAVDDMVKMLHICGAKTVNALTAFLNFMKITPIVPTRCFSKENIVDILSHINKSDGHVRAAYAIKLYNKTDLTIEQIVLEAQQYSRPINLKRAQSLLDTDIKALKRHKSTPPTSTIESTSGEFEHELITFRV